MSMVSRMQNRAKIPIKILEAVQSQTVNGALGVSNPVWFPGMQGEHFGTSGHTSPLRKSSRTSFKSVFKFFKSGHSERLQLAGIHVPQVVFGQTTSGQVREGHSGSTTSGQVALGHTTSGHAKVGQMSGHDKFWTALTSLIALDKLTRDWLSKVTLQLWQVTAVPFNTFCNSMNPRVTVTFIWPKRVIKCVEAPLGSAAVWCFTKKSFRARLALLCTRLDKHTCKKIKTLNPNLIHYDYLTAKVTHMES